MGRDQVEVGLREGESEGDESGLKTNVSSAISIHDKVTICISLIQPKLHVFCCYAWFVYSIKKTNLIHGSIIVCSIIFITS